MRNDQYLSNISAEAVDQAVQRYEQIVPEKLKPLDLDRYNNIPAALADRRKAAQDNAEPEPYLTRGELSRLMEWKLKHGTFRPKLLDLVRSNSEEAIRKQSRIAFADLKTKAKTKLGAKSPEHVDPGSDQIPLDFSLVNAAMTALTALSGVGPATASLILSAYDPDNIPFYSDELTQWSSAVPPSAAKTDASHETPDPCWKTKLKYNVKEYSVMYENIRKYRLHQLATQAPVACTSLEKTAWVLRRQDGLCGKNGQPDAKNKNASGGPTRGEESEQELDQNTSKKEPGTSKRKQSDNNPVDPPRRQPKRAKEAGWLASIHVAR